MVKYTRPLKTSIVSDAAPQGAQKKGDIYKGFVALAISPNGLLKIIPSAKPTRFTSGNVGEWLARMHEIADESNIPEENLRGVSNKWAVDGAENTLSLRVGYGGNPYIRVGDPPEREGRSRSTIITE